MHHLHLRILKVVQETPDSISYFFDAPGLQYVAGQFLTVIIPQLGNGVRRAYSFCSSPSADKYPGITVKRIENGLVSRYIHSNWKEEVWVECLPPAGKFVLPQKWERTPVFVAAGSGIVPIISMIKQLLATGYKLPLYLVYSNHSKKSSVFLYQLEEQVWSTLTPHKMVLQ
ncbi:MAG: FAD-binding oxidoreductase [Bacteroidia bacterium]